MSLRLTHMAALTDTIALIVGEFDAADISDCRMWFGDRPLDVRSRRLDGRVGGAHLLVVENVPSPRDSAAPMRVVFGDSDVSFSAEELLSIRVPLQTLIRESLAPRPAHVRGDVLDLLAATTDLDSSRPTSALTRSLCGVREALRERLSPAVISRDHPIGLAVECVLAIDQRRFFMQGWFRDSEALLTSLRAVSPEGASVELLDRLYRFRRTDLEQLYAVPVGDPAAGAGFSCCFDLPAASTSTRGWVLELRDEAGNAVEAGAPAVVTNRNEVRDWLLGVTDLEQPGEDCLTRKHVHPAIDRLLEMSPENFHVDRIVQFGTPADSPDVSIVVPLYRRIDLLEHQLAQFASDPEIARNDLIYVLDSPELSRDLIGYASLLVDLYRVPFRVVTLRQNVGFAGANMAGTSLALGRLLLFMNSDVLPERPRWLGEMVRFHDSRPAVGAVGPKLLFEDDSIQHAGLYFRRPPNATFWENEHCFKGLHRGFPAANVSRRVPAVTAACMLVSRSLFNEIGGFSRSFVRGDYEDSDLCLRIGEAGFENWYLADVALYHLEGQSYESAHRRQTWRYNSWLHTARWGDVITRLMADFDPAMAGVSVSANLTRVGSR